MSESNIKVNSLVLYKSGPAVVTEVSDKIAIQLKNGKTKRVRSKDVELLHIGPVQDLNKLEEPEGNVREAWELMVGETTHLQELAELIYGDFSPATAWGTWLQLKDGLYFEGKLNAIIGREEEAVTAEQKARAERLAEKAERRAFLDRVKQARLLPEDRKRLVEAERVALGQLAFSRILESLEVQSKPEHAYRLLLRCGYWPENFNPWPLRQGADLSVADLALPDLAEDVRKDLTHLPAFAIDDEGNQDPDDAISIDGDRLWVHVADVAAIVRPNSHLDQAARTRGANLYLPEGVIPMLPPPVTPILGVGLSETSPALSFGFKWTAEAGLHDIEITPSTVRVTRLSYDQANLQLDDPIFASITAKTEAYEAVRMASDAANIDLPEVSLKVLDGEVQIRPLPRLRSRQMVTNAMLMAGEAAARFASEQGISIPYMVQAAPQEIRQPETMSAAFAYRRLFKPGQLAMEPGRHFGLGLDHYARATSPLRRYQDLLTHQQLRNFVTGKEILSAQAVSEHMGESNESSLVIRRSERQSNMHWKLVYLRDNPDWSGEAVVVELDERRVTLLLPALAMETRIRPKASLVLDQRLQVKLRDVDLPGQTAIFSVLSQGESAAL